jgi:hypothetical protein
MLIAWTTFPVTPLLAGWLADYVLEPGMRAGGGLAPIFAWLVGTGPGAGMALLMAGAGLGTVLLAVMGYLVPAVREAEERLEDHEAVARRSEVVA